MTNNEVVDIIPIISVGRRLRTRWLGHVYKKDSQEKRCWIVGTRKEKDGQRKSGWIRLHWKSKTNREKRKKLIKLF